jgi:hypothetical protein
MSQRAHASTTECVCSHHHEAHEHYRRGSDCAICGPLACRSFRAVQARHQLVARDGEIETPVAANRGIA